MADATPSKLPGESPGGKEGDLQRRYLRAAEVTAPRLAASTPGAALRGYWISDHEYFFLDEQLEKSLGRRVWAVPTVVDARTGQVRSLFSASALTALCGQALGGWVDLEALASADFDVPDPDTLVVGVAGKLLQIDTRSRKVTKVTPALRKPAQYSSDRRYACFCHEYDVWIRELASGTERALTTDGAPHYRYGQPSESLSAVSYGKSPSTMGLWSPDSRWFVTHRIDERSIPELALIQNAPPEGGRPAVHSFRYSLPGDPLPLATVVAFEVDSGQTVSLDDFPWEVPVVSPFFFQQAWFGDTDILWLIRADRYFKHAELIRFDLAQRVGRLILSETTSEGYLDFNLNFLGAPNIRTLPDSNEVIWFSERDGRGHLYLYDASTGSLKNQITTGDFVVRDIVDVDNRHRRILFLASDSSPGADRARRMLCSVSLDGAGFQVVLTHAGDIFVPATQPCAMQPDRPCAPPDARPGVSPTGEFAAVRYASARHGNWTEIVDLKSKQSLRIAAALPEPEESLPIDFEALAADGRTTLHGLMFVPPDFNTTERYPLVDYVYPGPHIAHKPQSFRTVNSAPARCLAELGFIVIMLDTRGVSIGTRAFRQAGYGSLLEPQLCDHAAVVQTLCAQHAFIDADRVGALGQSAGGAAAARLLLDYGEIFKVGVAACGNHDSNLFMSFWSDKFRGPGPAAGWAAQANSTAARKLTGKLLLIAADMDENVHVSQTLGLVDALIRANKDFDLVIVPNEAHLVLMTSGYAQRRAWDYFVRHLKHQTPPSQFELTFTPQELRRFSGAFLREARE